MVPVGLGYGELAGLPMAGLYGSIQPLLATGLDVMVGLICLLPGMLRPASLPTSCPGR